MTRVYTRLHYAKMGGMGGQQQISPKWKKMKKKRKKIRDNFPKHVFMTQNNQTDQGTDNPFI